METWQHNFAKVNKLKLHYVQQGSGPLVILLHGFPEFWYSWRKQIPVLAQHYNVVAVDMRGYNLSEKPAKKKHYKYNFVAADIRELIIKLGYSKASIIGHDWGGGIAWHMIHEYPGYLEKVIVLNCPPPQVLFFNLFNNWQQIKKSWYMFFFQLPWLPEFFMGLNPKRTFTRAFKGWAYNKDAFTDQDIDRYVEAFSGPKAFRGPINYYRAAFGMMFDPYYRNKWASYVPTRVIWGEGDRALGVELTKDLPKYFLGKFDMKFIPNASHWVQNDEPELVNQYILEFLALET